MPRCYTRMLHKRGITMLKVTGLIRRGSTYSLRRRVPSDLVKALGKTEVVIALHTSRACCDLAESGIERSRWRGTWSAGFA
ncbi:DUF6538 domain-containing protein, partial [Rhizobium ruizarguesonis]